jgi:sugar lactone lactonase YvrE
MKLSRYASSLLAHAIVWCVLSCHSSEAASISNGDRIFWANSGQKILSARPDGSDIVEIVDANANIGSVDIDPANQHVYWSSGVYVSRCDFDGSNVSNVVRIPGSFFPGDMALDVRRNQVFFTDGRNHIIYRSDLNGNNLSVIRPAFGTPTNSGLQIWLDADNEKLYWMEGSLKRSNLDGGNVESLFTPLGVRDFEIDSESGKLYWVTETSVRRANLDGTQSEVLVSSGLKFASGIALDRNAHRVFYTDTWAAGPTNYDGTVRVVNYDGTQARVLINVGPSSITRPEDVAFVNIVPEPSSMWLLASLVVLSVIAHRNLRAPDYQHKVSACMAPGHARVEWREES